MTPNMGNACATAEDVPRRKPLNLGGHRVRGLQARLRRSHDLPIRWIMLTRQFADAFAAHWIDAWNAHDLDAILSHYADDFEMSSPMIALIAEEPSGTLRGKAAVRAYWAKALQALPTLRFELEAALLGANSITLYYKGVRGMAAEVFVFDERGKVCKALAHYA